jgi:hypothetical protein
VSGAPVVRVWWNEAPASTWHDITGCIAAGQHGGPVVVHAMASTRLDANPLLAAAHERLDEPAGSGEEYVEAALARCAAHRVDVVVPRRELLALTAAADRFAAIGTTILAPPGPATALADDKPRAYEAAAALGVAVPDFAVVADATTFRAERRRMTDAGHRTCVRRIGVEAGEGFRIVHDGKVTARLRGATTVLATEDDIADALDAGFGPLLLTRLLTGPEYSIDVLAHHGSVVAMVPRRRDEVRAFVLERHDAAEDTARRLVEGFGLHGVVNVQVIVEDGTAHLIEINPRPAGGLHQSAHTGCTCSTRHWWHTWRDHPGRASPSGSPGRCRSGSCLRARSSRCLPHEGRPGRQPLKNASIARTM